MIDPDFADLDAIIAEEESKRAAKRALKSKRAALASGTLSEADRLRFSAELASYEAQHTWQVVANVALLHTQECVTCGSTHRFFKGWFTEHKHRSDKHSRKLVAGRSTDPLPVRIEEHSQGPVEMCGNCAESCLLIDAVIKGE